MIERLQDVIDFTVGLIVIGIIILVIRFSINEELRNGSSESDEV